MRRLLLVLVLSSCVPAPAQAPPARWSTPEANRYWSLKEARIEAYRKGDRSYFERLLADNFVTVDPGGRRLTRAQYLDAEFGSGDQPSRLAPETEVADFQAARTGTTLVLTYEEWIRTRVGGQPFAEHLRRLDVYALVRGRWRLQTMTAVRIPEAPATIAMSAAQLAQYAGTYAFAPGLDSTVRLENGRLHEKTTGQQPTELLPIGPDLFYAPPDLEARVAFERDAEGRVVAQVYRSGSQVLRAPRVP